MTRPLLITDCDEVLLHMVRHFGAWLEEAHAIDFRPVGGQFAEALRDKASGAVVPAERVWPLLDGFFATEMARQTLVPGAAEALARIAARADVVILTNLGEHCLPGRVAQLAAQGIAHRVVCNGHGPKGAAVAALVAEHAPDVAVFVDDLGWHHASVAEAAPAVFRLHMVAEPAIARDVPPAPAAHARIDDWDAATDWILTRFDARRLTRRRGAPRLAGMSIDDRLAELGHVLPEPAAPVAAYVPTVEAGGLLHVSGQLPFRDGQLMAGRVGEDRDEEYGRLAAERCGIMLLAQIKAALGSLDRVERIVKLGVFVSSAPTFSGQPKVANGASELMVAVFGEAGRHARSAVGVPVLPLGAVVEVDAVVAIKG